MDVLPFAVRQMRAGKAPVKPRFYARALPATLEKSREGLFQKLNKKYMDVLPFAVRQMRAGKAPVKPRFYARALPATLEKSREGLFQKLKKEQLASAQRRHTEVAASIDDHRLTRHHLRPADEIQDGIGYGVGCSCHAERGGLAI